jgi:hypothetical protein
MRLTARTAALLLIGFLVACSSQASKPPTAAAVLQEAGHAMAGLHSVSADIKFGPGVTLQGLTLTSATSKIQLPTESDTVFKVKQGDFLLDLRVVTTGGHVYLRLPFSGFTEATPEQAKEVPNLSGLFDPNTGLPAILPQGQDQRYLGTEQVSGVPCDKVSSTYTAAQIGQLLGVQPAGDVKATIWAGQSDHYVRRVTLAGPLLEAGKEVQVDIYLHDFNQPVAIPTPSPSS